MPTDRTQTVTVETGAGTGQARRDVAQGGIIGSLSTRHGQNMGGMFTPCGTRDCVDIRLVVPSQSSFKILISVSSPKFPSIPLIPSKTLRFMLRRSLTPQGFQRIVRAIKRFFILLQSSLFHVPHTLAPKKPKITFVFSIDNAVHLCYSMKAVGSTGFSSLTPKNN